MGTRSLTIIMNGNKELTRIYRQFDGYPSSHGLELAKLCNVKITNGISGNGVGTANGMGCLAAQIIMALKGDNKSEYHPSGVGGIYIEAPNEEISDWVEYVYIVRGKEGEIPTIECTTQTGPWPFNVQDKEAHLFTLRADKVPAWVKKHDKDEDAA